VYTRSFNATLVANFGQDSSFAGNKTPQGNTDANGVGDFYYAPPSGFLALAAQNLPTPAIDPAKDDVPADYFNTVTYTGDGASTMNVSVGWQPDLFWVKSRGQAQPPFMVDAIRTGDRKLRTDRTDAESTGQGFSFTSTGWSRSFYDPETNTNGDGYVSWNWLAGNGTSSNTDGATSSTVSANTKAGFSIVSWSGTGSSTTIGHGLDSTPELIINKNRDAAENWVVYSIAQPNGTQYLRLNQTSALVTDSSVFGGAATSTTFTVGTNPEGNGNGNNHIAYCFHSVASYSSIGTYTGNGSTDGPFVYTGFRPAWVMVKRTDGGTDSWNILDNKRDPDNVVSEYLNANSSVAAANYNFWDFTSNGFKIRNTGSSFNENGYQFIYMAFAENPFKYANAR